VRGGKGRAFKLALRGRGKNPFGVGAHVRVHVGARTIPFIAHAGVGYMSSGDPRIHVGVGAATTATVDVDWPSGQKTAGVVVKTEGTHTITEP
jgi:enediyne biosynthesis protein E4